VNVINFKVKNRKGKNEEKKTKKKNLIEIKKKREHLL
jgi:hypothetical protein